MYRILITQGKKVLCAAVMIVIILFTLVPLTAYAAANPPRIAVNQVFNTSDGIFTYRLQPLEPGNPMPGGSTAEGYTFTITGTGGAEIKMSSYSQQGIYRYKIFQVIGTEKPGYTYDKRVYTIEIHVDEILDVKIVILNEDGKKAGEITFQNTYNLIPTDPSLMPDSLVRKTVFGDPSNDITFKFILEALDPSNPMPSGSTNGVKMIYITGSGKNGFGVWSYDKTGTYYYRVYEVNTKVSGYTYDAAVYTITDMVKEENGKLILTRVVANDSNKPVTSMIFNNYYTSGGGTTEPPNTTQPSNTTNPPSTTEPSGTTEPPNTTQPSSTTNPPSMTEPSGTTEPPNTTQSPSTPQNPTVPGNGPTVPGNGPKTGDDSNTDFYFGLFMISGFISLGAAIYLIIGGKLERRSRRT